MPSEADRLYAEYQHSVTERKTRGQQNIGYSMDAHMVLPDQIYEPYWNAELGQAAGEKQGVSTLQEELPPAPTEAVEPEGKTDDNNQWKRKHIQEDHDSFWCREWVNHNRNVSDSTPLQHEQQELERARLAAKARERTNATASYGYHYRGEQADSDTVSYPFHRGQVRRSLLSAGLSSFDQRYGNCRMMDSSVTMPVTFLKHKNPRHHIGLPRSGSRCSAATGPVLPGEVFPKQACRSSASGLAAPGAAYDHFKEPAGSDTAAAAAYAVYQ